MVRSRTSLRDDPWFGVDSRWSWVTAGFLSWLLSAATVSQQALAVFFYGIVHSYGASRGEASWPLILCGSCTCLGGPLMGYLCRRASCQAVLLVCSVAAGIALCICSLADSILILTIFFGIVLGVSLAGIHVAVNVLASQHFEKRRATACSIIFFFAGLNMLFVPTLAEFFRVTYGIRGTFLLFAGITLNACPAVIVTRSPEWMTRELSSSTVLRVGALEKSAVTAEERLLPSLESRTQSTIETDESSTPNVKYLGGNQIPVSFKNSIVTKAVRLITPCRKPAGLNQERRQGLATEFGQFWTLAFAVNALSFAVIMFGVASFLLLSVDIATDKGVAPYQAVFLLNAFAVGDIVLRPLSGLVIDSGLLSLEGVMLLGFFLQCISYELLVWLRTFVSLLVCSVLAGVSNGLRASLQAPCLVNDFGVDSLPLLMGGVIFCNGVILLTRPFLVGYCRDHHGSYDMLLHMIAGASIVLCCVWAAKYSARRRKHR
ncbi:monocarboxylate transporter 12-like [Dermacentor andersoni]|uniref:monocarboxylate transporter 12-like n=1 Tax=Dermacentor andersoni TaxID=34620 RepID=UPI00215569D9|nr:monocarboxylate transporter 3-like [Dermacentor andersoni]XP_054928349.1 monocarboxylate transporter 3-like [Dermacentor andersoni]